MLKYGNKEFRNLEEQVGKNAQDIQDFKDGNQTIAEFGITVVGIVEGVCDTDDFPESLLQPAKAIVAIATAIPKKSFFFFIIFIFPLFRENAFRFNYISKKGCNQNQNETNK